MLGDFYTQKHGMQPLVEDSATCIQVKEWEYLLNWLTSLLILILSSAPVVISMGKPTECNTIIKS